ncbi:MAG: RfaE bifunctional protein domain, partial [Acidimicrobiales bacterium]|nr:RfaE bifunctional protein domain [Acidimicrobiales bacterium]
MTGPLVVLGDTLLDRDLDGTVDRLCPEAPAPVVDDPVEHARAGGAALAAPLIASDGADVVLVTALASDGAGRLVRGMLSGRGVAVVDLGLDGATPEKIRVRCNGRSLVRIDIAAEAKGRIGPLTDEASAVIAGASAILVSDYGRGVASRADVRYALATGRPTPVVWDPHPRGPAPVAGALLVTPNSDEAAAFVPDVTGNSLTAVTAQARALVARWHARNVVVTLGERGALLVGNNGPALAVPAHRAPPGADTCGAGDRFAGTAASMISRGALPSAAVADAVAAASAFVAPGAPGAPPIQADPTQYRGAAAEGVVARVRADGGTVVAAGGCFDLLHAGHVRLLSEARSLGDCLIVCLNSDDSVRRLKGPGRPVVPAADRAALLRALGTVDAVAVFEEDTPAALLDRLRPDVFAKGADYGLHDLPEARMLARWGGQAVVLPYLEGRSTSHLLQE